jgi:hypothetical protein
VNEIGDNVEGMPTSFEVFSQCHQCSFAALSAHGTVAAAIATFTAVIVSL